ncbi:MAG TPA: glycoside hydrolase family 3 N-terminal domain-containing protein [Verrucomicrobiae bacterium]|nr:glycoside hydrolase family 3 N-terminal domain-containing protein [Verrucomicrobiae bacterium]
MYNTNTNDKQRDKFINGIISTMSLDQKVGQCFTIHWGGSMVTPYLLEAIERLHIGGIRVTPFGQNSRRGKHYHQDLSYDYTFSTGYTPIKQNLFIPGSEVYVSPEDYAERLNQLQAVACKRKPGIPLHVSIDQEGDISRDYCMGGINLFPSAMGLTATGDPKLVYEACKAVATQLSAIGATNIHSPVLDVNLNPNNPEINIRAYGDDAEVVAEYALASIRGYMDGGLVPTAKHFPGRGNSDVDAHYALPEVPGNWERLERVELFPYRRLIENGLPSIMLAHTAVPAADPSMEISTVSRKIVTGLLRERLGFNGVITTDSITMGALMKKYGVAKSCALAIKAGCDLVLNKTEDEFRDQAFCELKRFVEDGEVTEEQLDVAVRRILTMKYNLGLLQRHGQVDAAAASKPIRDKYIITTARKVAEKCVTVLRDEEKLLPLEPGQTVMVIEQQVLDGYAGFDVHCHKKMFNAVMYEQSKNIIGLDTKFKASKEDEEFLMQYIDQADVIVATNYYWRLCPANNTDLIRQLIAKGKKVIVVTNCPYEMGVPAEAKTVICNYSVTPESLRAAARVIYGKLKPQGKWMLKHYAKPVRSKGETSFKLMGGITASGENEITQVVF